MDEVTFHQVGSGEDKRQAGALIREYLEWLNARLRSEYDIEFDVEAMLRSDLYDPHKFHPPKGRILLARVQGQVAGVGCLSELEPGIGELQRMYVLPAYRKRGIGRALTDRLIDEARSAGYRQLRLESLEFLGAAHSLYRSVGFREIDPYADNSMEAYQATEQLSQYYAITVFMEMTL